MACWPFPCCSTSTSSQTWRTPKWPSGDPSQTRSHSSSRMSVRFRENTDDGAGRQSRANHGPAHRRARPTHGILRERQQNTRDAAPGLRVRNPGVSVTTENIPRLFPQTPGNGRPGSMKDPIAATAQTLANTIQTPLVCTSWVNQPVPGTSGGMFAAPVHTAPAFAVPATTMPTMPMMFTPAFVANTTGTGFTIPSSLPAGTVIPAVPSSTGGAWVQMSSDPGRNPNPHPPRRRSPQPPAPSPPPSPPSDDSDGAIRIISSSTGGTWVHIKGPRSRRRDSSPPRNSPPEATKNRCSSGDDSSQPCAEFTPFFQTISTGLPTPMPTPVVAAVTPQVPAGATWMPHPFPIPTVSPAAFWNPHPFSVPRQWVTPPSDPTNLMRLTGGVPLPGTAPGWVTPVWPAQPVVRMTISLNPILAPNPNDARKPHLVWNIAQHPYSAKRLTGREIIVPLSPNDAEDAVFPAVKELHIYIDHKLATADFWGPIVAKSEKSVTILDVLTAVYDYGQRQISHREYSYICSLHPENEVRIVDAFQQRCRTSHNLEVYEHSQGVRRIDTFGDDKRWWGMWVTHLPNGQWYLNLGSREVMRVPSPF